MAYFEKPDFKTKRGIPIGMKLILLIAVIAGLWGRSCWRRNELANITFENIRFERPTSLSVEVLFEVVNDTSQSGKKPVILELYTSEDELIAQSLFNVYLVARQTSKIVKTIDQYDRPLKPGETVKYATIRLYHKSIFSDKR